MRQATHCRAVLLVEPTEFQPELPLCQRGGRPAADDEQAQRHLAVAAKGVHAGLQRAELLQSAARQNFLRPGWLAQRAYARRDSNSAVARSSSAITLQ